MNAMKTEKPIRPPHIIGEAKAEWERVTHDLDQQGRLSTADRSVLTIYCQTWARYCKAEAEITKLGEVYPAKNKAPMSNPWLKVSAQAHEQCRKLLVELGLTPAARAKIKPPKEPEDDSELEY